MPKYTKPAKQGNRNKLISAALLFLLLATVLYFQPWNKLTVIDVGQITVDPNGYPEESEGRTLWKGTYWAITAVVTANDDLQGFTFSNETASTSDAQGKGYTVHTGASIEIKIDPDKPYLLRKIKAVAWIVTPAAGRTWRSRGSLDFNAPAFSEVTAPATRVVQYDWADSSSWEIHTPYWVTILKNGVQIGRTRLDNGWNETIQIVPLNDGSGKAIRIENLGRLGSAYTDPVVPPQICILNGRKDYVYDWTQAYRYIPFDSGRTLDDVSPGGYFIQSIRAASSDAYSLYWYGQYYRWTTTIDPAQSPAGYEPSSWSPYPDMIDGSVYAGWKDNDDFGALRRDPMPPVIFPEDKTNAPLTPGWDDDAIASMCLTEFVASKNVQNLADTIFRSFDSWSVDLVNKEARIEIPWGAYGVPEVHFRIPVEVADTWVDRPPISNVKVSLVWASTGTKTNPNLYSSDKVYIDMTQLSTVESTAKIIVACTDTSISVFPTEFSVSLKPNETQRTSIDIVNAGHTSDTPFTITVQAREVYGYTLTSEDSVTGIAKALIIDQTFLRIYVIDAKLSGDKNVAGIQVQCQYPPKTGSTMSTFTEKGRAIEWTLQGANGGAYIGEVYIQTKDTFTYKAAYTTRTVKVGLNIITISLIRQGETPPNNELPPIAWILVGCIGAVSGIASVYYYKKRKTPKMM